jgi:ribose transport system substrate-binding protein
MNRRWKALLAAGVIVVLAGCGAITTASDEAASDDSAPPVVAPETMDRLRQMIAEAEQVPEWKPAGPEFDASAAAGKSLFVMPVSSQLPVCDQVSKDMVTIAQRAGLTATYFQNDGQTASWVQGINQAITQGFDAIALVCGINPDALAPQMQQARDAGIAVVDLHLSDVSVPANELIAAQTSGEFAESMRLAAASALVASGGAPIDALVITSNENPPSVTMQHAVIEAFSEYCGDACEVRVENVPIPDWATKVQSTVSSALVANRDIRAVIPVYDGMIPPAVAAIQGSGVPAKVYSFGGTPEYVRHMGAGAPIGGNNGPGDLWMAYSGMDQVLRLLSGQPAAPASDSYAPYRLWTPNNWTEVDGAGEGFGTEFESEYLRLWGLAP